MSRKQVYKKIKMKTFEASRLSDGNKIFPAKIDIDNFGVTLKIPGLLGGKEKTLSYSQISSVAIDTPMIGFSKITFDTLGFDRIVATGFSKDDAQEIKQLVQQGISGARSGGGGNFSNSQFSNPQVIVQETKSAEQIRAEAEAEAQQRKEVNESDARFFDGAKKLFMFGKNKAAKELHHQLEEIEADIRVAIAKGDKDKAGDLIRKLKHDSTFFIPGTNITYSKYWADKREECLNKL